ncbi:MAG TPA: DUF134 domain-containing protein [Clostridia bacterium]|nr:DUF134 domain-containing protein [Clostridia bacterium]
MARPFKWRRVERLPAVTYFKPVGIPLRELEEVVLLVEEMEALRLKDHLSLEQEACAQRMEISRPTFQRILTSARTKIVETLVEGKALRIEGGNYELAQQRLRCKRCGHEWEALPAANASGAECPACRRQKPSDGGKGPGPGKPWRGRGGHGRD